MTTRLPKAGKPLSDLHVDYESKKKIHWSAAGNSLKNSTCGKNGSSKGKQTLLVPADAPKELAEPVGQLARKYKRKKA